MASPDEFRAWCAVHQNLTSASVQAEQLVHAMRAFTVLLGECGALPASPAELAAMQAMLTQQAEIVQAHIDAVAEQQA